MYGILYPHFWRLNLSENCVHGYPNFSFGFQYPSGYFIRSAFLVQSETAQEYI